MDIDARAARVAELKAKLRAREGKVGSKANCEELRAMIAELEAE